MFFFFFISTSTSGIFFFFFFNDTATTEIYTLSLHDALPISRCACAPSSTPNHSGTAGSTRSEEHTSELQSHLNLVCRLLLEKKKKKNSYLTQKQKKKKRHREIYIYQYR